MFALFLLCTAEHLLGRSRLGWSKLAEKELHVIAPSHKNVHVHKRANRYTRDVSDSDSDTLVGWLEKKLTISTADLGK